MALQYAAKLPTDASGLPMQNYPTSAPANARHSKDNASTSSVITLGANTTVVEVAAVGQPAVIKWIPTTDTAASVVSAPPNANFDNIVVTGEVRRFVVPIESYPTASILATQAGRNLANGLYQRVAFKTTGIGSVLLSEY